MLRPPKPPPPVRNKQVQDELDQLRQRGLAKLFNKHFTGVAQTIAAEKAAADAALRDLEARKARMKDHPVSSSEITALDKMYLELQQKRADCKRKERETLLLYQRYVDKFGNSGAIALSPLGTTTQGGKGSRTPGVLSRSSSGGVKRRVSTNLPQYPPSMPTQSGAPETVPGTLAPQITQNTPSGGGHSKRRVSTNLPQYPPAAPSTPTQLSLPNSVSGNLVPQMAQNIEANLNRYVSKGADQHPSIQNLGLDETYQSTRAAADHEDRVNSIRFLEGKGVDAKATLSPTPGKAVKTVNPTALLATPDAKATTPRYSPSNPRLQYAPSSSTAARFGMTSSTTPEPVGVPQMQRASSQGEDDHAERPATYITTSAASTLTLPTAEETMQESTDIGSEMSEDDKSIVSGLTSVNSMVGSEAEARLLHFLKTETDAIRQMMVDDDDSSSVYSLSTFTKSEAGSESTRAAAMAEDMVKKMQNLLDEYKSDADEKKSKSREPYELETGNEKWMVHFDENNQREYYYNPLTNVSQWEKPDTTRSSQVDDDFVPIADYTKTNRTSSRELLTHHEVMPEGGGGLGLRVSRRELYRRKQRRRRTRRRIVLAVAGVFATIGLYYARSKYKTDPAFAETVTNVINVTKVKVVTRTMYSYLPDVITGEATRRAKEEAEMLRKELERIAREEEERRERARLAEEAEKKAREEAARKKAEAQKRAREERERRVREKKERERKERERRAKEAAERKEREKKEREERQRKAKEAAEQKAKEEAERRAKEAAARKAAEEAARKAKEEANRKAAEEAARKAAEEAARKAKEEADQRAAEEAARKAREEAERKAAEEAARKAKEEAARKAAEEAERIRLEQERLAQLEADRIAKEEAERKAREEEEQRAREEEEKRLALIRPWHCHVPMAHFVHDKCRMLAGANPLFADLESITHSMLQ